MNAGTYLRWWASGVVVGVGLTLAGHLLLQSRPMGGPELAVTSPIAKSTALGTNVEAERPGKARRVVEPQTHRGQATKPSTRTHQSSVRKPPVLAKVNPVQPPAPAKPSVAEVAPLPPEPILLKPLGYVEKAGGRVEAIVSDEDQVYVVHEGETVADKYKVLKISSTAVEVADLTRQQPVPSLSTAPVSGGDKLIAAASQRTIAIGKSSSEASAVEPEAVVTPQAGSVSVSKPIGYVEKANGEVQTVIADGEHVRLAPEKDLLAANANSNIKLAGKPKVKHETPASAANASSPELTEYAALKPGAVTGPSFPSTFRPVSMRQVEPDWRSRSSSPTGLPHGEEATSKPTEGTAEVALTSYESSPGNSGTASQALGFSIPIILKTIGYVERSNGVLEAILSEDDTVYIVREGQVFADRYRALKVSPTIVEALDISPPRPLPNPSPPPTGPSFFGQMLAMGMGRGKGYPDGAPTAVPHQTVALRHAGIRDGPGPPPPKGPPGVDWSPSGASQKAGSSTKPTVLPRVTQQESAEAVSVPVPAPVTLKPLGYVEMADGQVKAIVENEGEVCLVRKDDVLGDRYRVLSVLASAVTVVEGSPEQARQADTPEPKSRQRQLAFAAPLEGVTRPPPSGFREVGTLLRLGLLFRSSGVGGGPGLRDFPGATLGLGLHSNGPMADDPQLAR